MSTITNKDRINDNNDRINRLIELVKQKALTSNPKYAATEEEMEAMLTDKNIGKVVKYIGTPTGTPPAVGDVVDKLYFNTDIIPNFEAIKNDSTIIKGADIHQDFASSYFALVMEVGDSVTYLGFTDMSEMQEGLWALMFFGSDGIIYLSQDVPAEITGGDPFPAGWQMDSINVQEAFGGEVSVTQIGGQEVWSAYISKEPFTGGKYEKNALYIIEKDEKEVIENPTAVGDEVTQIYFDTTKSAEEVYNALMQLDWDNPEINEDASGFYLIDNGGSFDEGTRYGVIAVSMNDIILIQTIVDGGGTPHFAYSTTAEPSALGLESWGWLGSNPATISPSFNIAEIKYKDIWGSFISTHENGFTSISEPTGPRARRLNITEGTLTITKNGTFNVANMETVIVNVAGSGSGGSLVATTEEELNALDTPENVGKTVSYNDGLYIITED